MRINPDNQLVAGYLVAIALINFGSLSRDGDHDRFCWFLDKAIAYAKKTERKS